MADKITLDAAHDLMDKWEAEAAAATAATDAQKAKIKKKEQVKDLLKEGAKQGLGGLGLGAQRQLKGLGEEDFER